MEPMPTGYDDPTLVRDRIRQRLMAQMATPAEAPTPPPTPGPTDGLLSRLRYAADATSATGPGRPSTPNPALTHAYNQSGQMPMAAIGNATIDTPPPVADEPGQTPHPTRDAILRGIQGLAAGLSTLDPNSSNQDEAGLASGGRAFMASSGLVSRLRDAPVLARQAAEDRAQERQTASLKDRLMGAEAHYYDSRAVHEGDTPDPKAAPWQAEGYPDFASWQADQRSFHDRTGPDMRAPWQAQGYPDFASWQADQRRFHTSGGRGPGKIVPPGKTPDDWVNEVESDPLWTRLHPNATPEDIAGEARRRSSRGR